MLIIIIMLTKIGRLTNPYLLIGLYSHKLSLNWLPTRLNVAVVVTVALKLQQKHLPRKEEKLN